MKTNGNYVIESLELDDARTGYRVSSCLNASEINRACVAALKRRGMHIDRFNRMDFARPKKKAE